MEPGTLYHLRNILHRSNVSDTPKSSFNAYEDFFLNTVVAHCVAAALKVLGMGDLQQPQTRYVFPDNLSTLSQQERHSLLSTICKDTLGEFLAIGLNAGTQTLLYLAQ